MNELSSFSGANYLCGQIARKFDWFWCLFAYMYTNYNVRSELWIWSTSNFRKGHPNRASTGDHCCLPPLFFTFCLLNYLTFWPYPTMQFRQALGETLYLIIQLISTSTRPRFQISVIKPGPSEHGVQCNHNQLYTIVSIQISVQGVGYCG